ncbi:hypothetical protein KDA_18450 [Dictyobacter alpinus]|uniref:histidine kinase n=1 Tax=Dictyobacter alpinus TaxID=2014873 RepID=A0A402B4U2_9CHLR|nr:ATP-binding protein [Dictyobacter alpinus]GCE26361.1 hypothetical protein KDA_18450 [Dictyobacter alpinus]
MMQIEYSQDKGTQLYRNIGYHMLALPLGILYFVLVLIGVVLTTLNILLIGIPLIMLFTAGIWRVAAFERMLSSKLLNIQIAPMAAPFPTHATRLQRFLIHIRRAGTWKSLAYLFLKFPFGIFSFVITLISLVLCLLLCLCSSIITFLVSPFVLLYVIVASDNNLNGVVIRRNLPRIITAGGLALLPINIINGLAILWGHFAQTMLGMNQNAIRLAEVTAIAELERTRAEQAEQSRRELIMNVSHDLRTPVASIRGHLEALLLSSEEDPETLHTYLQIAHRETLRLGTMVEDLLSLARNDSHELSLRIERIDAGAIIEEVYQAMMPLARRERQISLVKELPAQAPGIMADSQRLRQVLLNLVRNAITYTPDGGIVAISLEVMSSQDVMITVADTGIGIEPEEQEQIFERFYRTDSSRTRSSGGFGLGLSIVHDFVTAMGGTIVVKSVPGEGSSFHIHLKAA